MYRCLIVILFLNTSCVHSANPPIPVYWYNKPFNNDGFIVLTKNYTDPAILRGYINVSAFSNVCACNGTDGVFDDLEVVYIPNKNTKQMVHMGTYPPSLTAGADYWEKHVCQKENTYTFYEKGPLESHYPHLHDKMAHWFAKIENIIKLSPRIRDPRFLPDWFQEVFLGYADKRLQSFIDSGSGLHQGDVQNYYIQICGTKRWIIGKGTIRFNDERDFPYSGQSFDGEKMFEFISRNDTYIGWTRPGDMLLNPVWLWHLVQTDIGTNFGMTYKMGGDKIREIVPEHLRPRVPRGVILSLMLFARGHASRLWVKQPLVVVLFFGAVSALGAGFLLSRRHQKTS